MHQELRIRAQYSDSSGSMPILWWALLWALLARAVRVALPTYATEEMSKKEVSKHQQALENTRKWPFGPFFAVSTVSNSMAMVAHCWLLLLLKLGVCCRPLDPL
jgi:hypothetical protein